jgi:MOSC domain-containing protein YiiM
MTLMIMIKQESPIVVNISISPGGIPKLPVDEILVTVSGLLGDGHNHAKHCSPMQAVCLQDVELLEDVSKEEGIALSCGAIGENLTVRGLSVQNLSIGTGLEFEGGVILEITKVRMPCYVLDSIDVRLKEWLNGRCGMYAKVVREGVIKKNEGIRNIFSSLQ